MNPRKTILLVSGLALCLASIVAHYVAGARDDVTGVAAFLNNVFHLTLALSISVVLTVVGHAVARLLRVTFANGPEEISFSLFLGTGVVGLCVLGLGLLEILRPWAILLLTGLLLIASWHSWSRIYTVIGNGFKSISQTRETKLVAALFTCVVVFLMLRAVNPPNAADELIYHLPVTQSFVEQGRIYPNFDNALGNLPFLIHMIYALFLMLDSDIGARLFSLFLASGTALALYGFCSRYLTRRTGVVAMFAFFAAGMVVEVAITTRIDVSLAGVLFLATYAIIN
jgi:hypothetical protein